MSHLFTKEDRQGQFCNPPSPKKNVINQVMPMYATDGKEYSVLFLYRLTIYTPKIKLLYRTDFS